MSKGSDVFEAFIKKVAPSYEQRRGWFLSNNVEDLKAEGDRCRQEFLKRACLERPSHVRLIDCHATCEQNHVVLIDGCSDQQVEYAAISHTFGMEVYGVFNCECTAKCSTKVPRCLLEPCLGHDADSDPRNRVVKDILNMCAILRSAGIEYAWHDGVCIAQHNIDEVDDTIKHIGWIYSHAKETIIFLHYVGTPMAPIKLDGDFISRWQSRVWTLQEAALSKHRRYCVRVGTTSETTLGDCKNLQELEDKIALWYRDDSSKVTIIEEEAFWKIIQEIFDLLIPLVFTSLSETDDRTHPPKEVHWSVCIFKWMETLLHTCIQFPTITQALHACSIRDSKHEGDRINSILALVGVKDFIAPKDGNMEVATIEFFKRQGQQGLARAVFTANTVEHLNEYWRPLHTWLPILSSPLKTVYEGAKAHSKEHDIHDGRATTSFVENFIEFTVLEDGKLELRGEMACIPVKFTYMAEEEPPPHRYSRLVVITKDISIAMHLTIDVDETFTSVLAQGSSLALGTAIVPVMKHEDHGQKPIDCHIAAWADVVQHKLTTSAAVWSLVFNGTLERACSTLEPGRIMAVVPSFASEASSSTSQPQLTQGPSLTLGTAILPRVRKAAGWGRPVVQGRAIQAGESFCAHMVLPLQPLLQHGTYFSSRPTSELVHSSDYRVPALLVQGDLNSQVSKLGCFLPHKVLKDLLPTDHHLMKIQKLVII